MIKLDIIMKGKKFAEKLFGIKKRQINRALEDALDNIEKQKVNAETEYDDLLVKLADDNVDYKATINKMIKCRETIMNADDTYKIIKEVKDDLYSEVKESEDYEPEDKD